jgi:hypothetical protein
MCPVCISGGAVVVSGMVSTAGVAALAAKLLHKVKKPKSESSKKTK